jgi:hypothetical protein
MPRLLAIPALFLIAVLILSYVAAPVAAATLPPLPKTPLHTEVTVEVNKKGQVVRITSTKPCKINTFNLQTFGNALQMWIRKPDGTAQVGLYRIIYDYDPATKNVARHISLVKLGGDWGDSPGAATVMIENARKQAEEAQKRAREQNAKLPSLNEIRGVTPSPKPTLQPM